MLFQFIKTVFFQNSLLHKNVKLNCFLIFERKDQDFPLQQIEFWLAAIVFKDLLNYLGNIAKEYKTDVLEIIFETVVDKEAVIMYHRMAKRYGFKIAGKSSAIEGGAIDIIWTK